MPRLHPALGITITTLLALPHFACAPADAGTGTAAGTQTAAQEHDGPVHFVRYQIDDAVSYGVLEGGTITVIDGDVFGDHVLTSHTVPLSEVDLLPPTDPQKVIAVGLNYQSHLGDREASSYPGLFAKYPTSLVGHEDDIVRPPDSHNLHYEGELVLVIGRKCSKVSEADAQDCIFAVTAGNDVSERDWQAADLQWLRAKGSDTFGPVGPSMVVGLDPDDLLVETRVNGEVRQSERTSDLIFNTSYIVSYISQYVSLEPGDLIFTGTPGSTQAMEPGDVVEIEVEGVGVLRNTVR